MAEANGEAEGAAPPLLSAPMPVTMGVAVQPVGVETRGQNIAVLGATGRTGIQFVQMALERGYEVRGVCRNPDRPAVQGLLGSDKSGRLEFVEGDVWEQESLRSSIRGCDMVFSFLEFSHKFGGCFDFQRRFGCCCTPAQRCNAHYRMWALDLCAALRAEGVRRLVLQSTWFSQSNWWNPVQLSRSLNCGIICIFRAACGAGMWNGFQDIENEIKNSDLDFTIVHCPILDQLRPNTRTSKGFKVAVGTDQMLILPYLLPPGCPYFFSFRSYPDAARFFVEHIDSFHRQSVAFC
mmetsp:Transcript_116527/g.340966  ORF Transcript_116527/g.340966 Transcript_116527/m.340966 type:complete len:293 (+) Transcript_116527:63-941(+)